MNKKKWDYDSWIFAQSLASYVVCRPATANVPSTMTDTVAQADGQSMLSESRVKQSRDRNVISAKCAAEAQRHDSEAKCKPRLGCATANSLLGVNQRSDKQISQHSTASCLHTDRDAALRQDVQCKQLPALGASAMQRALVMNTAKRHRNGRTLRSRQSFAK